MLKHCTSVLNVLFNVFKAYNKATRTNVFACWKQSKTGVLKHCLLTTNMFCQPKEWNLSFGNFTFRLDNQSFVMFLCSEYIRESFFIANAVNSMAKQVKDLFKYFSKDSKIYYFVYYQLNFLTFSMPNLCYFKIKGNEVLVLSLW